MKKCKDCAHYNVCEFHIDEETSLTVEECGDFMDNNCKYKTCLAKLFDMHVDCKDCMVVKCIKGVTDINVRKKGDEKMRKVFISQPMKGKSDEEIKAEREDLITKVKERFGEVYILDSYFVSRNTKPLWCLAKSLVEMSKADIAYFAHGWENARGCKIEHLCAVEYGIDREYETVDIKIEDMDLSVRSYNCLKRAGLNSLSQLSKLNYEDFTNIRNLGKRNVDEIIDKLKYYGYEIARRW